MLGTVILGALIGAIAGIVALATGASQSTVLAVYAGTGIGVVLVMAMLVALCPTRRAPESRYAALKPEQGSAGSG